MTGRFPWLPLFRMCLLLVLAMAVLGFTWIACCRSERSLYLALETMEPHLPVMPQYCREGINIPIMKAYSQDRMKQDDRVTKFRSELASKCRGATQAIITQRNTPVGTKIVYDGDKKSVKVNSKLFSTFAKESPFVNKSYETCAVVGNGGILANSSCGDEIDAAQIVLRCNLPPVDEGYQEDAGRKTNLVTANPSIFLDKFGSLMEHRRPFVDRLGAFGDSLLLLPTFSYGQNTAVSLRALYTVQDFHSPVQPVFLNPSYLRSLAQFWRAQGLHMVRLSTGLIVASLALELCKDVHLYGFWPFPLHPQDCRPLTNHYYDDQQTNKKVHAMPEEFGHLLRLHTQGVLRLHLGECAPKSKRAWASHPFLWW